MDNIKELLESLHDSQLDIIYKQNIGYSPISEGEMNRTEVIELLSGYHIEQEPLKLPFTFTEYRGFYLQTFEKSDSFVTYTFSDKACKVPVKAMTAGGKHQGSQFCIKKALDKIDDLIVRDQL